MVHPKKAHTTLTCTAPNAVQVSVVCAIFEYFSSFELLRDLLAQTVGWLGREENMNNYNIVGTGESLLLIHGVLVSQAMWQPQIVDFSKNFQVSTLDLPAHGNVQDINGEYSIEALAEYVIEQLNGLNINQVHVYGHSLGGMVAQQLAATYPERVQRLILAETAFGVKNSLRERIQASFAKPFL